MENQKIYSLDHNWEIYDKYDLGIISEFYEFYTDYSCKNCGAIKSESDDNTIYIAYPNLDNRWEKEILPCSEIIMKAVME